MDLQKKRILTADEASEYTGYAKTYILSLTSSGKIPFAKPNGRKVFIEREKLEDWMLSKPDKTKTQKEAAKNG